MKERLQKLIAQAGIASRRAAEDLISRGEVSVNGAVVTELGTKADPETDHIKVSGKLINSKLESRKNLYLLVNKPKGYLSSASDPEGRKLVVDLVKGFGRLHPVGRLDFNTEGLIILTNDGEFTNKVASSKKVPKVYQVKVKGLPSNVAVNKLRRGVRLVDEPSPGPSADPG
ncbi:MAG: pseudouridine synthase, partial [Acidobacteriota bacterium]